MTPALQSDIKRSATVFIAGWGLGWFFGNALLGISIALGALFVRQSYAIWKMRRWMLDRHAALPRSQGMLGEIENRVERTRRQARKRKKRLGKVFARFQQTAEANPDGSIIVGDDGCIEWLNKAAAKLMALRQGQDHGQPIANLIRNPGFSAWLDAGDLSESFELDSPSAASSRLLFRMVPYGNSKRMLTVRDITRLHQLEQVRRDFVANVSHELRSPLTVIVGYLESMGEDSGLPEMFHRPVAQMAQQSARMTRIVEDLLRLSRIENDPEGAAHTPINISDLASSVLRDARRLSSIEHALEQNLESTVLLLGDYNEIYSALSNLVFNAVQYTPAGGTITLNWLSDESGGACLEVRDTGEGIEPHHIPRLTERFYRVDKARSREVGGTGLGLAIVKHVLNRHDATLEVSSEPGKGSVFRCKFPASRVRDERADADPATGSAAEQSAGLEPEDKDKIAIEQSRHDSATH